MEEIKFDFKEEHRIIAPSGKSWNLELNLISWNDREPKYDIRSWSPDHTRMGKGITLSADELKALKKMLDEMAL